MNYRISITKGYKVALFQVYTYSGLLLLILLAEFGAGIAALVHAIYYLKTWCVSNNLWP